MLIETLARHDSTGMIRRVSIEALRARGQQLPPQITRVPALVLMPSKQVLFGKEVFDYLLLPGTGVLVRGPAPGGMARIGPGPAQGSRQGAGAGAGAGPGAGPDGPEAYSLHAISGGLGDAFAPIEDEAVLLAGNPDRSYSWSIIDDAGAGAAGAAGGPPGAMAMAESVGGGSETRPKKALLELDAIRSQREADMRGVLGAGPPR